jgi:hypothetical protein
LSSHSVHPFITTVFVCSVCPLGIDLGFRFVGLVLLSRSVHSFGMFCSSILELMSPFVRPFATVFMC